MPRKIFVAGEILTASDVNTNLMDQSVMVFDDASARTTAIPTPVEGMVTYLEDVGGAQGLEVFDGAVFTPVAIVPDPPKILQVVQTVKDDVFTSTSGASTDVTGLNVTITPTSATSKILVTAVVPSDFDNGGFAVRSAGLTIFRGATNLCSPATSGSKQDSFAASAQSVSTTAFNPLVMSFLDSPATTSATNYKVSVVVDGGPFFVNRARGSDNFYRAVSTITVMEVAG